VTATPDERRGVVTPEPDGGRRLVFRRSWPDPIDDVWSALTEPERTTRWIGSYTGPHGSGAEGVFTMTSEAEPFESPVTIVECDPPRRLVLQWTGPFAWRVELDLTVEDGRTVLVFTQVLPTDEGVVDIATGWHWYLDKLDTELTGRPAPAAWDDFLAEVGAGYAPDRA
jgi:uncharacterized protein YndB with AHSA1/START domain